MNVFKLARKYPDLGQEGIMALQDTFLRSDADERGYLDEATAIKTAQDLERKPYDEVRATLKQVELDSSRRVELDDFVDVCLPARPPILPIPRILVCSRANPVG